MSEQKTLMLQSGTNGHEYIDLSSALTASNRKQYHQTTKKGVPYGYHVTIHFTEGSAATDRVKVITASNNWTVRNAVVKTAAAWRKQLKDAGIRMKDLSKYGRRLRIPLNKAMSAAGTGNLNTVMDPIGWDADDDAAVDLFQTYTAADGEIVTYKSANAFSRFAIPDEAGGDSVEMNLALMGVSDAVAVNAYFGVVDQYVGSRGGIIDEPASAQQTPDSDNLLQTMFSSTQPSTDEIIEAVEDYAEFRPYNDGDLDSSASPVTASTLCKRLELNSTIAPLEPGAASDNSLSSVTVHAPLGLLRLKGAVNKCIFKIEVHSIYEM